MVTFSGRDEIVELINKLFVYTDMQEWEKLQNEIFSENVLFDMSSLGKEKIATTAKEICETWQDGFIGIDSINHLAGNYLVEIHDITATVFAYATATHYKASAKKGKTREFVGTYDLKLMKHSIGWRIYEFSYTLKYATGNMELD